MRVRLNVATRPLVTQRRFLVGAGTIGLVAALVFLGVGWHVYRVRAAARDIRDRLHATQQEIAALERQRGELEQFFSQPENQKLDERAAYLNTIIDARSFDWTQMFMDMERLLPDGVRVVSIAQKLEHGRVVVAFTVAASSTEAKLKFLRALENSPQFSNVLLLADHPPNAAGATTEQSVLELKAFYARS